MSHLQNQLPPHITATKRRHKWYWTRTTLPMQKSIKLNQAFSRRVAPHTSVHVLQKRLAQHARTCINITFAASYSGGHDNCRGGGEGDAIISLFLVSGRLMPVLVVPGTHSVKRAATGIEFAPMYLLYTSACVVMRSNEHECVGGERIS